MTTTAKDPIQAFYEKYPHPDPIPELPAVVLTGEGRLEGCPSWCFHVYWPKAEFRGDLDVLIAGCGTAQAAIYGASLPQARIVAIDVSAESLANSTALCRKHGLNNVQHRKLDLEQAGELGSSFDLVISTGVLHHLPDPDAGLRALRDVLRPEGSLNLMVYAKYGRAGVYYMQEMLRRIGITAANSTDADLEAVRTLVRALPPEHPLTTKPTILAEMANRAGVTDLFLNPRDRAYAVPDLYALLARCGLVLQEWYGRSQYEPECLGLSRNPLMDRMARLPVAERYAVGELFSTRILRHRFVACREDRPRASYEIDLDAPGWQNLIPVKHRSIQVDQTDREPGRSPWVSLVHHRQDRIRINFDNAEADRIDRVDGRKTIAELHETPLGEADGPRVREFWRRLYRYDFVWFRAAPGSVAAALDPGVNLSPNAQEV